MSESQSTFATNHMRYIHAFGIENYTQIWFNCSSDQVKHDATPLKYRNFKSLHGIIASSLKVQNQATLIQENQDTLSGFQQIELINVK
jgi:hypothetical protein